MHSEYRFPRSAIFLMLLVLVGLVFAIESARRVAIGDASDVPILGIVRVILVAFGSMCLAGVIGYGVLRLVRRSGTR